MLDISTISSVSAVVAAVGVLVGIVFAVLQLRDLAQVRQAALAIQLNPWLRITGAEVLEGWAKAFSLEFEDYDDFVKKYGSFTSGKPIPMAIAMIINYYERVALFSTENS